MKKTHESRFMRVLYSAWVVLAVLAGSISRLYAATVLYSCDFDTDRKADFYAYPASFHHDPTITHPDTLTGAMVFGTPGESFGTVQLRVPAQAGKSYEVVSRCGVAGTGQNTVDQYISLVSTSGAALYTSPNQTTGDKQIVVPSTGTAPAGTAWLNIKWVLRGTVLTNTTRHIELYQLQITELDDAGPRPFKNIDPYINRILGFVSESVTVDMTDCFTGTVSSYSNDAGIPMTQQGNILTFTPTTQRTLSPAMLIYASNSVGRSITGAQVYFQCDPTPAQLSTNAVDTVAMAQFVRQCVEPGQVLFPINCDKLFNQGLPPYTDVLISAPAWVEMPVNGLVGGRCPTNASPSTTSIVIRRTDARGHTAQYTIGLNIIAARNRTPTHTPVDSAALVSAMATGGNVIQLRTNTTYQITSGVYGLGRTTTSTTNPAIILGASGAKITQASFNYNGHYIFENAAFELTNETDLVIAKKVAGLRLVSCSFKGVQVPVDLNDGTTWMTTDLYRYAGNAITAREQSFVVVDGCYLEKCNTAINTLVDAACFGVFNTISAKVADDHCFFQQSGALWVDLVDFLGQEGNHTSGEHRDVIQLANPNQPPDMKVLIRRVFGYCDGTLTQGLFLENETQRIDANRLPYWIGNHRDVLIENSAFIDSAGHGIYLRGLLEYKVRNCLTLGNPDVMYNTNTPAFGQILIRSCSQNGLIENTIAEKLSIESPAETAHTSNILANNFYTDDLPGGYYTNRITIFPNITNTSLSMKQRVMISADWALAHPTLGPDILKPAAPVPGLFFVTNGADLVITAKNRNGTNEYWKLRLTGAASSSPAAGSGMITEFYDLTGDAGSHGSQNLANSPGLFFTASVSAKNIHSYGAALSAPVASNLVNGASTYSYSLVGYSFKDDKNYGTLTFTSDFTIRAPDDQGTRFVVTNTLATDSKWDHDPAGGDLDTRYATECWVKSALVNSAAGSSAMTTSLFNGWQPTPSTNAVQWAQAVATSYNPEMPPGTFFLLTHTAMIGTTTTHSNYTAVVASYNALSSEEQLSGAYRGNATNSATYKSTGTLDINITK